MLYFEAKCTDLISEKIFKSPATGEKYRNAHYQVSMIPCGADVEFAVNYRKKELARVQVEFPRKLRDTLWMDT